MTSTSDRQAILDIKAKLLPDADRAALEAELGRVAAPMIERLLEERAQRLLAEYRKSWSSLFRHLVGDTKLRDDVLVDREAAAAMLGVSVSTVKRMEANDELEPIIVGERNVRYRVVQIEKLTRTRFVLPSDPND